MKKASRTAWPRSSSYVKRGIRDDSCGVQEVPRNKWLTQFFYAHLPCPCLENEEKWKTPQSAGSYYCFRLSYNISISISVLVWMNRPQSRMCRKAVDNVITKLLYVCLCSKEGYEKKKFSKRSPWVLPQPPLLCINVKKRCGTPCALNFTRIPYNLCRRLLSVLCVSFLYVSLYFLMYPQGSARPANMCSVPCILGHAQVQCGHKGRDNCNRRNINST